MTMKGLLTNSTYIGKEVYKNFEKDKVLLNFKRKVVLICKNHLEKQFWSYLKKI